MNLLKQSLDFEQNCYWYVTFSWMDKWNNNLAQIFCNISLIAIFGPRTYSGLYSTFICRVSFIRFVQGFYRHFTVTTWKKCFTIHKKLFFHKTFIRLKVENMRLNNRLIAIPQWTSWKWRPISMEYSYLISRVLANLFPSHLLN